MCGIYCYLHQETFSFDIFEYEYTKALLENRGPDGYSEIELKPFCGWHGLFAGSTLWTQGPSVKLQPLVSPEGSIFLWNGDSYKQGLPSVPSTNDAEEVFHGVLQNGVQFLTSISGPYSFIYLNKEDKVLWFGRDALARHSLLWSLSQNAVSISSVGMSCHGQNEVIEVPHYALFKLNFSSSDLCMEICPWYHLSIPRDINIKIPFSLEDCIRHKLLPKFGGDWLGKTPEDQFIIHHPGPVTEEYANSVFEEALNQPTFFKIVEKLEILISNSVGKRIKTQPRFCKNCLKLKQNCKHSKIGILFSGGLDSAVLAHISNSFVDEDEPIDLFNVSFQRSLNHKFSDVPDRISGLKTLKELRNLFPNRTWNFIEINVTQNELDLARERHISKLISPLTSVLDDSLGCALWFAARGQGLLDGQDYHSPTRVVLLGMGADEMFGGYTRHRKAYANGGWEGLGKELWETLNQIGVRNLGRDNRIVADHGRQPRMPYLDEELVAFIDSLPPWQRCFLLPNLPVGIGDKFILRLLAWKLRLLYAAILPKKALQFGSHIANPKEKGHLKSSRLSQNQKF